MKKYVEVDSGSNCKLLSTEYKNKTTPLLFKCECGEKFEAVMSAFEHRNKRQCNTCGRKRGAEKLSKLKAFSYSHVKYIIEKDSGCTLLSEEYKNVHSDLEIMCKCGNTFTSKLSAFISNKHKNCALCSSDTWWSYRDVKTYVEDKSNSGCKLLSKTYQDVETDMLFLCECGNEFKTMLSTFRHGKRHCSECTNELRASKTRLTQKEIKKRIEGYNCKYISGEYQNVSSELKLLCSCGNTFFASLASLAQHSNGVGKCDDCSAEGKRAAHAHSYDYVYNFFKEKNCELLSTGYVNRAQELRYIADCGHTCTTSFNSFVNRKFFNCRVCSKKYNTAGEKNYNWKGGTYNSESEAFRKTYEFKQWARGVYSRDDYTCQLCGVRGGTINAHHLDGYNWCVEKRTDVDNGITLCEDCHKDFHSECGYGDNTKEQFEEYKKQLKTY